ncbi:MAG: DUF4804 domain-containing protein [Candidatus Dependentiae bacterium]|nr:DUF4804 domain-containing protein [Candidatus Dependentiae bacterium]
MKSSKALSIFLMLSLTATALTIKKEETHQQTFNDLVQRSQTFAQNGNFLGGKFPTNNNRIAVIAGNDQTKQAKIAEYARNTYPIMHGSVLQLINEFMLHKKTQGSPAEQALYKDMTQLEFIDRLLTQRPLMFMTSSDSYLLRDGKTQGSGAFETIGTAREKSPLILKNYISYDEMQIASLIGVSVPTYFINNGDRNNKSVRDKAGTYQEEGVYVGLVGARFEKPGLMEYQHMLITQEQNTTAKGYGSGNNNNPLLSLWADFYGVDFPTFNQARNDATGRYSNIGSNRYLNNEVYKKRMRLVIEPFLRDAHKRGTEQNKKTYVHNVGLGIGVWAVNQEIQAQLMLEVYAEIIDQNDLSSIADIDFSWFPATTQTCGGAKDGQKYKNITLHFSKRNPADPLIGKNKDKLLIANYAWDGNSYPGNEYWAGMLNASGDPAAACCSTISELQNPLINTHLSAQFLSVA